MPLLCGLLETASFAKQSVSRRVRHPSQLPCSSSNARNQASALHKYYSILFTKVYHSSSFRDHLDELSTQPGQASVRSSNSSMSEQLWTFAKRWLSGHVEFSVALTVNIYRKTISCPVYAVITELWKHLVARLEWTVLI